MLSAIFKVRPYHGEKKLFGRFTYAPIYCPSWDMVLLLNPLVINDADQKK